MEQYVHKQKIKLKLMKTYIMTHFQATNGDALVTVLQMLRINVFKPRLLNKTMYR